MSVFIPIPISEVKEAAEQPSLTYSLDLEKGRIIGKVDGLQAINQAINKALISPRFKCLIYDSQYGSEIKDIIADKKTTTELIEAMIPRLVQDALKPDTRILSAYDFSFDFTEDGAYISFKADTVFGETTFKEVI